MSLTNVGLNLFVFGALPAVLAFLFRLSGDAVASRYCLGASLGALAAMFLREATLEMTMLSPLKTAVLFWTAQAGSAGPRLLECSSIVAALAGCTCGILCTHWRRSRARLAVETEPRPGKLLHEAERR